MVVVTKISGDPAHQWATCPLKKKKVCLCVKVFMLINNVTVFKKCHLTSFTVSNLYKSKEVMLSTSENITTTKKKMTKCDMAIPIKHCWNGSRHRKMLSHKQPNFKGKQKNLQINYSTRIMHVKTAGLIILKSGITLFMPKSGIGQVCGLKNGKWMGEKVLGGMSTD